MNIILIRLYYFLRVEGGGLSEAASNKLVGVCVSADLAKGVVISPAQDECCCILICA